MLKNTTGNMPIEHCLLFFEYKLFAEKQSPTISSEMSVKANLKSIFDLPEWLSRLEWRYIRYDWLHVKIDPVKLLYVWIEVGKNVISDF